MLERFIARHPIAESPRLRGFKAIQYLEQPARGVFRSQNFRCMSAIRYRQPAVLVRPLIAR
jgi:hypothetical protein